MDKNNRIKNYAIILASGSGSRYGSELPKQFTEISGRTIFERTIDIFERVKEIDCIILVVTPQYRKLAENLVKQNRYKKVTKIVNGGELRKDSSYNGIDTIEESEANVLIHDCARPFVSEKIILDCIDALKKHEAVGVAIPSTDTIIEVENGIIKNIPSRKSLMRIQTPQCFKLSLIKKAHELAKNDNNFTDDCGLIVKYNLAKVYIIEGSRENVKITYPEDIYIMERFCEYGK